MKLRINLNELEEKESLGSGASGEVKKANHKETGKTFALKIIPLRMDLKMKQLIEQEVRTLHNCKHENIIKCYASFFHVTYN
jgi:serine/threonine protein kinase